MNMIALKVSLSGLVGCGAAFAPGCTPLMALFLGFAVLLGLTIVEEIKTGSLKTAVPKEAAPSKVATPKAATKPANKPGPKAGKSKEQPAHLKLANEARLAAKVAAEKLSATTTPSPETEAKAEIAVHLAKAPVKPKVVKPSKANEVLAATLPAKPPATPKPAPVRAMLIADVVTTAAPAPAPIQG